MGIHLYGNSYHSNNDIKDLKIPQSQNSGGATHNRLHMLPGTRTGFQHLFPTYCTAVNQCYSYTPFSLALSFPLQPSVYHSVSHLLSEEKKKKSTNKEQWKHVVTKTSDNPSGKTKQTKRKKKKNTSILKVIQVQVPTQL